MKRITGDELPDFYNIVLERPKDDPDGYDVLFIDAAAKVSNGVVTGQYALWSSNVCLCTGVAGALAGSPGILETNTV